MEATVAAIEPGRLAGTAAVPPSKSAAHRAVVCAALAAGTSHIGNVEFSQDILATLGAAQQLGAKVERSEHELTITGRGNADGFATITRPVFCNESGSTLRFILPLFSLTAQKVRFTGAGRLMQRPQEIYAQLFERQGLRFEQNEQGITIFGRLCPGTFALYREQGLRFAQSPSGLTVEGALSSGDYTLAGNVSSQFISGLLFATPLMEAPSTIEVRAPFESRSYVDLTTDAMQKFGVKVSVRARKDGSATYKVAAPQHYAAADMDVEGDYSQAAFLAVLGSTVGGITITGLPSGSHQGDRVILDILKQCGAKFERSGSHVTFHRSLLKAVEIDLADCPDLGPVLIALGCFCSGTTIIRNAGRLRIKECDRIAAMQEELAKMGGTVKADGDTLTIEGCALHKPTAPLNGHNDRRIVMAMAVAALAAGQPAVIEGANAVNKSWPDFFEVIKGLGAHVTNQG